MTKILNIVPQSTDELLNSFIYEQIGIDTIRLIGNYATTVKNIKKMGLALFTPKRQERNKTFQNISKKIHNQKTYYSPQKFKPIVELVKLPNRGNNKNLVIVIVRNIPILFDVARHHEKVKDTFCMVLFTGLHQPSYHIKREAIKIISAFCKKKTLKIYSLDVAIDTIDPKKIDYKRKESFKANLMPYSKHGVYKPPNGATTLMINHIEHESISRIILYDKTKKQTGTHHQKNIPNNWKRLEITSTFDVTDQQNKGFNDYIESLKFIEDLRLVDEVATKEKIKHYRDEFLEYQLNSILDNRTMNNKNSSFQFNSIEALQRFKQSESRFKKAFNLPFLL